MQAFGTKTIETDRLILRRFTADDAEDMYRNWASDPEVTRFLTWPTHASPVITGKVISSWIARYADGNTFNWGICLKEEGVVIGSIAVVKLDQDIEAADIGYCLGRAFWGQGIMTEALKAVMDHLFDEVGLRRIAACHDIRNPASGRVMEKAGMKKEGVLRQSGKNNMGICDHVWYAMIQSDRI